MPPLVSAMFRCQVYGPESSGKTTVALHAVAQCQKAGEVPHMQWLRVLEAFLPGGDVLQPKNNDDDDGVVTLAHFPE